MPNFVKLGEQMMVVYCTGIYIHDTCLTACFKCYKNNNHPHQEEYKTEKPLAVYSLQQNALSLSIPLTVHNTHLLHSMQITAFNLKIPCDS